MITTVTTSTISSVCLACGVISKSGKLSCCADGGSWLGNCGSAGDAKFGHTWHEGIQSCKAQQLQIAVGKQQHASQPEGNASSNNNSVDMHSKAVTMTSRILKSTPSYMLTLTSNTPEATTPLGNETTTNSMMRSALADKSPMTVSHAASRASTTSQKYEKLLHVVRISMIITIVYWH